ncbi:MAG: glycosyl hydrolase [Acetobacteraceae bacterium]|nr:glycosyl hydrolase [Acetobacteraceae bacterium]
MLSGLKWRCIGPSRGGRVVAVAGDFNNPMVFYFGACAGGIWKTIDGGIYWRCVSDGFLATAAVGAIAVARSDSNVIYAGMGETTIRLDVSYGDGVYKSTDAGATWTNVGLRDTKHIGRVLIHPANPDIAYVAALGDIFGPHEARGVYRTTDGGKTWQCVLHRDADSGAVDMAMDASNPRVLYATIWQTRRNFWNISSGGPGCGLFKSTDGGDTWTEISRNKGLPTGPLGKIGVAVSPAQSGRVWALVEAEGEKCGLYRSDDHGATWVQTQASRDLMHRPWYYTHVFADPSHADTVYVTNLCMWKSTDGGTNFTEINTSHGDNHDLWIDPADSRRMIEGNDGGAQVTFNGGITWSSIYNQPTGQFYRIDTDNRYPYRVYGTQQDNTSIAVPTATVWGAITLGDCTYPGTGESGFIAVKPNDQDVVFVGAVGSSPGGAGALQRYDYKTDQISLVNVWPEESTGVAPRDLKYRFAWTFPIVFSPHDPDTLYAGGNVVFKSTNEGQSWQPISPDLSLNDKSRQGHSGGDITRESAGAEVHATTASVVENPHRKGEIWAATDDGLVHVMRAGGNDWTNVTPPSLPELAYVGCVEPSPFDADTVYVAATRYKLSDYKPYLYRTSDGGRSWTSINGNFPEGEITRVVRADPVRRGLLFAGTETGVFFTLDDGASWARLPGGLPIVPVYDLKIKDTDLVAGTHGRAFWVLDDLTALRNLPAAGSGAKLLPSRPTVRTRMHFGALGGARGPVSFQLVFGIGGGIAHYEKPDGTKVREHLDIGENPPGGAIIWYTLPADHSGPVTLAFRDAGGKTIAAYASDDTTVPAAKRPSTRPGLNRYIWDMRHPGPAKMDNTLAAPKPKALVADPDNTPGPLAIPGNYTAELTVGGATQAQPFTIVKDPRLPTTPAQHQAQLDLLLRLNASLDSLNQGVNRLRRTRRQLAALAEAAGPGDLAERATSASTALAAVEGVLVDVHRQSPRDALRNPAGLNDTLVDLINTVAISDREPTAQAAAVSQELMDNVAAQLAAMNAVLTGDIAEINRAAASAGIAHVPAA